MWNLFKRRGAKFIGFCPILNYMCALAFSFSPRAYAQKASFLTAKKYDETNTHF